MTSCAAYGCTNRPSKKIRGITFHRFPKNPELRAAWIKAIRRINWEPTKYSRLCSEHFSEDRIDKYSQHRVYLRENAVPNVFKNFPTYLQQTTKEACATQDTTKEKVHGSAMVVRSLQDIIKQEIMRQKPTVVRSPRELLTKEIVLQSSVAASSSQENNKRNTVLPKSSVALSAQDSIKKEAALPKPMIVRSPWDLVEKTEMSPKATVLCSPQGIIKKEPVVHVSGTVSKTFKHSPAEVELLQKLNEVWQRNMDYKKKIKSLHQARRRHDRTIRHLKALLKDLKKKTAVSDESHDDDDQKISSNSILTPDGTIALQIIKI